MSKVFTISQYEGNSGQGNSVFSKTGRFSNCHYMSFQNKVHMEPTSSDVEPLKDREALAKTCERISKETRYKVSPHYMAKVPLSPA